MHRTIDDKYYKNHLRGELFDSKDQLVILTGKFKKVWDDHITFTAIRPYIPGVKTYTICNHICIYRKDAERVIEINNLKKNDKYYIIGYCRTYSQDTRMGIKLAIGLNICPLIKATDFIGIPREILRVAYKYNFEEYSKS